MSDITAVPVWLLAVALMAGLGLLLAAVWTVLTGPVAAGAEAPAREAVALRPADRDRRRPLAGLFEPQTLQEMSELRKQLMQAGFSGPGAVRSFAMVKLLCALFGIVGGMGLVLLVPGLATLDPVLQLCSAVLFFLLAYFLPTLIVEHRRRRYLDRISLALPDALDLMLVCVEAGQSVDHAMMRVRRDMRRLHPDLAARFEAASEALKAGADRGEVLNRLAWETDNDDLRAFASVVMQSAAMGTPIAETFRVYAADLRDRRARKVEERVNMLPTKMTLGTMLFTVPPLLLLLLTPSVFRILQSF